MKRCLIVGAAPCPQVHLEPREGDLIIAADGGLSHLRRTGIAPDIVIGDFDSSRPPKDGPVQIHPKEKDDTDMMLAIRHGLLKGYRHFEIHGGIGGRLDHTFANLQALSFLAHQGAKGELVDGPTRATVIHQGTKIFDASERGIVSVFSFDEKAEGVDIIGLKYPLRKATLTNSFPLGISNAFTGKASAISVQKGSLLVIWGIEF